MKSNILEKKIEEFKNAKEYECWYLVKQPTEFSNLCYLVSLLEKYKNDEKKINLSDYINNMVNKISKENENVKISPNYRALRVAAFFGLIKMKDGKYENSEISQTFLEIKNITKGKFEKIELYKNIITRQIEKMFISSIIDEEYNGVRIKYKLFPVILLYKILLELGKANNEKYYISTIEYKYIVATTKNYSDFLQTLLEIIELRNNDEYIEKLENFKTKFDNRIKQALKQLDTLNVTNEGIEIKPYKLLEVREKVNSFESGFIEYDELKYIDFLCSTESLFDLKKYNKIKNHERKEKSHTYQKIFFGAPGTGKSYKVSKLIEETFGKDENLIKNNVIRTTIYQDYSYYDFIGNIMPENDGTQIKYVFKPGPFTEALIRAFENENEDVFLVIEEMSRGNIASIFGDIFQLLDRENGVSQYPIDNSLISQYIKKELTIDDEKIKNGKIYLPSNLHILGTVNTSDQNVNVMDTAFKRRFLFEYVDTKPVYDEEKNPLNDFKFELSNEEFNWIKLYQNLNKFIVEDLELSEDKQLGQFFLKFTENEEENYEQLNNKLLQYLWEDVVLASISDNVKLFDEDIKTFSNLYEKFKNREQIFSEVFIKKYGNYFGVGDELENEKVIG